MMFAVISLAASFANELKSESYIEVRADSSAKEGFLTKFAEILDSYYDSGRTVCDTTKEDYRVLVELYSRLSDQEKVEVNATKYEKAGNYTIGDLMNEIIRIHYMKEDTSGAPKQKLDQSTTIIVSVVVSIVGMSGISVLYILKQDNYIE